MSTFPECTHSTLNDTIKTSPTGIIKNYVINFYVVFLHMVRVHTFPASSDGINKIAQT
jgi:hypothetical protein